MYNVLQILLDKQHDFKALFYGRNYVVSVPQQGIPQPDDVLSGTWLTCRVDSLS